MHSIILVICPVSSIFGFALNQTYIKRFSHMVKKSFQFGDANRSSSEFKASTKTAELLW